MFSVRPLPSWQGSLQLEAMSFRCRAIRRGWTQISKL